MKLKGTLPPANALVVFEAAARLQSFSAAARELRVAQPAVTRHIRNLEDDLRVQLFERRNNAVRLTDRGEAFFATVRGGLARIADHAGALRRRREPSVTIGSTFGLANMWLAPRLPALRRRMKSTAVRLFISDDYEDYDTPGVDLSIRFGGGRWPGLVATLLMHERIVPVAAPDLARRHGLHDPANWPSVPLLELETQGRSRDWARWDLVLDRWTERELDGFHVTELDNYILVADAVKQGEGIALGYLGLIDGLLQAGEAVPVGPELSRAPLGYYLVHQPGSAGADTVRRALLAVAG